MGGVQFAVNVRAIGLECGRRGLHLHSLGHRAHLQCCVDANDGVLVDLDIARNERSESFFRDFDRVGARRDTRDRISSGSIARRGSHVIRGSQSDFDDGTRDSSACLIDNAADN